MYIPKFFTIEEAAKILRVSRVTIYRKMNTGELKVTHFGRRVLIPASFFDQLADANCTKEDECPRKVE
jgi:excisionase family DNA binding protein